MSEEIATDKILGRKKRGRGRKGGVWSRKRDPE